MIRKFVVLATSVLISFSASASDYTYKCEQRKDRSPIDPKVGKVSVVVTHVKEIASGIEYRGEYADFVSSVRVVVSTTKNGTKTVVKTTNAIAVSEDVHFLIDNNGILLKIYMDELDESSIQFKLNGTKVHVYLNCK